MYRFPITGSGAGLQLTRRCTDESQKDETNGVNTMKDVQSIAMDLHRKPSRKQVFQSVQALIARHSYESDRQGAEAEALANLYAYFLPNKPKKAKNDLEWVSKAVAVQDVRYYLNYLHEAKGKLTATDGHRLHWIETVKDRGFMAPMTGDVVSCDGQFPEIDRVIPKLSPTHILRVSELVKTSKAHNNKLYQQYIFPNGSMFNAKYVDDAVNGEDQFLWNPKADEDVAIHISSLDGVRNAVIMPIRK